MSETGTDKTRVAKYCPQCRQSYFGQERACPADGSPLSLPDPYHLVGRTIAEKYRLDALAGIGGMGAVYCAHHLLIDRRVAVKILQPNIVLGNERVVELFEREAKTAGRLHHENIANVMDAGHTSGGIAYIAMEWIDGATLLDELIVHGQFSFERTARILRQVARALTVAHEQGVIHRDLKPANIMLVKRADGSEHVKVLDFGIAKVAGDAAATISAPVGTPHYASPEQFRAGGHIDWRSDIYSLGALLYHMLAGQPPFSADSVHELIRLQMTALPPSIRRLCPGAPLEVEQLLSAMLAKDPDQRPQGVSEIPLLFERALIHSHSQPDTLSYGGALAGPETRGGAEQSRQWQTLSEKTATTGQVDLSRDTQRAGRWTAPRSVVAAMTTLAMLIVAGLAWQHLNRLPSRSDFVLRSGLRISQLVNLKSSPGGGIFRVAFSPDGKLLAYSSSGEGESNLWIKQLIGGEPRRITEGKWKDRNPIWSPDGQRLAFISDRGGAPGIWVIPYLGDAPSLLKTIDPDTGAAGSLIGWSKDGRQIFYESRHNLFALDLSSGQEERLTDFDSKSSSARDFRLSPDEQQIAYAESRSGKFRILTKPLRGGQPAQITDVGGDDVFPAWFPDGKKLAYSSNLEGIYQICLVWLDGRKPVQLTAGESDQEFPVVSPDGSRIGFISLRDEANVFSCEIATGQEVAHTSSFGLQLWPDISPDGVTVAFQSTSANIRMGESLIVIAPVDAQSQPIRLASDGYDVRWSPDSDALAFLRAASGKHDLWAVSASGRDEKRLTTGGILSGGVTGLPYNRMLTNYNWAPDSARIVYSSTKSGQSNLWTVSRDGANETMVSNNTDQQLELASPLWSPGGNRIAYVSRITGNSADGKVTRSVCVIESGQTTVVFRHDSPLRLIGWSETEDEIYVGLAERKSSALAREIKLLRVSVSAEKVETIVELPAAYLHNIKLSPDRRMLAFVSRQNGRDRLQLLLAGGRAIKTVVGNADPTVYYSGLTWSPDGKKLFYSKQSSWTLISTIENLKNIPD